MQKIKKVKSIFITQMFEAIKKADLGKVEDLIKFGVDLKQTNEYGHSFTGYFMQEWSGLNKNIRERKERLILILENLLENGAPADGSITDPEPPIYNACHHVEFLELMIKHNATLFYENKKPLWMHNLLNVNNIKILIQAGLDITTKYQEKDFLFEMNSISNLYAHGKQHIYGSLPKEIIFFFKEGINSGQFSIETLENYLNETKVVEFKEYLLIYLEKEKLKENKNHKTKTSLIL